jgi:hypothetical protein
MRVRIPPRRACEPGPSKAQGSAGYLRLLVPPQCLPCLERHEQSLVFTGQGHPPPPETPQEVGEHASLKTAVWPARKQVRNLILLWGGWMVDFNEVLVRRIGAGGGGHP